MRTKGVFDVTQWKSSAHRVQFRTAELQDASASMTLSVFFFAVTHDSERSALQLRWLYEEVSCWVISHKASARVSRWLNRLPKAMWSATYKDNSQDPDGHQNKPHTENWFITIISACWINALPCLCVCACIHEFKSDSSRTFINLEFLWSHHFSLIYNYWIQWMNTASFAFTFL